MDPQIGQQIGLGAIALAVGISGWVLPYEWNLLRLRRGFGRLVSESFNRKIPKFVGAILSMLGIAILVGTAVVGKF